VTSLADVIRDPQWFPVALSQDYETLQFGRITRDALAGEAFLDQRMASAVTATQAYPVADVAGLLHDSAQPQPVFVFHSAFCCSTLLARALDVPGLCLALKEPDVIMGVANALRTRDDPDRNRLLFDVTLALLARRFDDDEAILIKPTNAASNLLPHVLATAAPVLVLYGDLRSFLVSVLKKGEACKAFVRTQYNIFGLDPGGLASIPARQAMTFTDLQVAALVWRHQLERFQISMSGQRTAASLEFHTLLDAPAATLAAVAVHLGLAHEHGLLASVVAGPVFGRDAKFASQAYDARQRAADAATVEAHHAEAVEQVIEWAQQVDLGTALKLPLPRSLDTSA